MMDILSAHLTLAIPYITVYLGKYIGNNINPKQDSMDELKKDDVDRVK